MRTKNAKRLWPCANRPSRSVFALAALLAFGLPGSLATMRTAGSRLRTKPDCTIHGRARMSTGVPTQRALVRNRCH